MDKIKWDLPNPLYAAVAAIYHIVNVFLLHFWITNGDKKWYHDSLPVTKLFKDQTGMQKFTNYPTSLPRTVALFSST